MIALTLGDVVVYGGIALIIIVTLLVLSLSLAVVAGRGKR